MKERSEEELLKAQSDIDFKKICELISAYRACYERLKEERRFSKELYEMTKTTDDVSVFRKAIANWHEKTKEEII